MQKYNYENLNYIYFEDFFNETDSEVIFNYLVNNINWKHDTIKIFGKKHNLPRLTAYHADTGVSYSYSGIKMNPDPWTKSLLKIKKKIETFSECEFNSVLLNRYRNGNDYHGYHSDDEPCLGNQINIASLSFGAGRDFKFKSKNPKESRPKTLFLSSGSLLLMKHPTQAFWLHSLPKRIRLSSERINLTFRLIDKL